jgi:DNA-binding transcriptional LysR family regulator
VSGNIERLRSRPAPGFMALHPKVTLDVTLADRIVDLLDEGYDLAVRIARLPSSSLVSRRLSSTRLILCASPAYTRQHGAPSSMGARRAST